MTAPIVFLDTETTSLDHLGTAEAWEIAIIRREPDGHTARTRFFISGTTRLPGDDELLSGVDPDALKISGYWTRHPEVADTPDPAPVLTAETAAYVVRDLTAGAWIIGSNPAFDVAILDRLLRDHGLEPAWDYHLVDVAALAAGWLNAGDEPVRPPWRSWDLSLRCGVEPPDDDEAHTALGDAEWAMRLYDRITCETAWVEIKVETSRLEKPAGGAA